MANRADYPPAEAVTREPRHHFFGYYDKTPWNASGRYLLGMETDFMGRAPEPDDEAVLGLIDTESGNAWQPLARTRAWHWQLGAMLQWLPADPERLIVYNVRREGCFTSVVLDVHNGDDRPLPLPVYALSPNGRHALSVNFARLADMRPGYGYVGVQDEWHDHPYPPEDGIRRMDVQTGEHELILSLDAVAAFRPLSSMEAAKHWVNHVQVNTDGSRFALLHRWHGPHTGGRWHTRLLTAAFDGSELRCVADHGKVSHYDWRDEERILAWARQRDVGERYFLFDERTGKREVVGEGILTCDGHCSWSPDRRWILTDTYPDGDGMRTLLLYHQEDGRRQDIGRFFSPRELTGPVRCDLHPRWSRDGRQVCIDSAHEGTRQIYVIDVEGVTGAA